MCVFAAYVYSGTESALLALLLSVVLPPLTYVVAVIAVKRVKVEISVPHIMQKNREVVCTLRVKNMSILPLWRVKCCPLVTNFLTGEAFELTVNLSILPKEEKEVRFFVESGHCGQLNVTLTRILAYDVFRLFRATCVVGELARATVFPDTFPSEITLLASRVQAESPEEYSPYKSGWDRTEIFQIRDYVHGDSVKQIHWKLTTKYDRLIVRDPALPVLHSLLLLWEKSLPVGRSVVPVVEDAMCEAFISLCQTLVAQSVVFHVACNNPKTDTIETVQISGLEDLSVAAAKLLAIPATAGATSSFDIYSRMERQWSFSSLAYFTEYMPTGIHDIAGRSETTVFFCSSDGAPREQGEFRVLSFTPDNYAEALYDVAL